MVQQFLSNATHKVNEVFQAAIAEAINFQVRALAPEFVLLGLIDQQDSVLLKVVEKMGLDPSKVRNELTGKLFDEIKRHQAESDSDVVSLSKGGEGKKQGLYGTSEIVSLLEKADAEKQSLGDAFISTGTLLLAFFDSRQKTIAPFLSEAGLKLAEARQALVSLRGSHKVMSRSDELKQSVLAQFTKDLTEEARRGQLDPVAQRDPEIERVIQILSRRKKNNPVLIGEPGVGKTVIIEGLVQRIVDGEIPDHLVGKRVLSLEMGELVAGAKMHGEFEERLKAIKEEVLALEGEVILFIDEIHTVVGAGRTQGALDAANILKSALARGELQCVGATTFKEYKMHIESDRALERRFQPVRVEEPEVGAAKEMLAAIAPRYEKHHHIRFSKESLDAAVDLSKRYIFSRSLPDKAIDLIDEAGALKRIDVVSLPPDIRKLEKLRQTKDQERSDHFQRREFEQVATKQMELSKLEEEISQKRNEWEKSIQPSHRVVSADDIAQLVAKSTGIPVQRLTTKDLLKLKEIESSLARRVVGQTQALKAVSNALRRNSMGLRRRSSPIGSFLFLGPTGVGKTELAKAIAEFVLDSESALIRFDMSEFMERHETSKLIGSPPGYVGYGEGGQLTEKVRRQPYSVLLFDEVEKAHPDVFNMFLQILDDGHVTDAEGRKINFENTIIIFTSNLGSEHISQGKRQLGLSTGPAELAQGEVEDLVKGELKNFFRPEFLNRLDGAVVFHKLEKSQLRAILDLQIHALQERLQESNISLEFGEDARNRLVEMSHDSVYGARPLKRALDTYVENQIAEAMIESGLETLEGAMGGIRLRVERDGSNDGLRVQVAKSPLENRPNDDGVQLSG